MPRLSLTEFVYYGLLITTLVLYLTLYVRLRKDLVSHKKKLTQWWIVLSFFMLGVVGIAAKLVAPLYAIATSVLACAIAYYVVFIKYND